MDTKKTQGILLPARSAQEEEKAQHPETVQDAARCC